MNPRLDASLPGRERAASAQSGATQRAEGTGCAEMGLPKGGVANGARTHDPQIHNLVLCQLSYGHRETPAETNGEFTIRPAIASCTFRR